MAVQQESRATWFCNEILPAARLKKCQYAEDRVGNPAAGDEKGKGLGVMSRLSFRGQVIEAAPHPHPIRTIPALIGDSLQASS